MAHWVATKIRLGFDVAGPFGRLRLWNTEDARVEFEGVEGSVVTILERNNASVIAVGML